MIGLVRLEAVWGSHYLIERPPALERRRNLLYLPWGPEQRWGVFDEDGLALAAAWEHGPLGSPIPPAHTAFRLDQPLAVEAALARTAEVVREPLIYGGRVHTHFGHFLMETLPRWWSARGRRRILVHGAADLEAWWVTPWVAELLGALRLSAADFVRFDRPTLCRDLHVPAPSLRAQAYAHRVFGRLCRDMGDRLLAGRRLQPGGPPVYLSKSRLPTGVNGLIDEAVLEARLAAGGVEIVHPELMTTADKAALFATRPAVLGVAGSGFHLGLFAPPMARQLRLTLGPMVNSGHKLADALSGCDAVDLHQPGTEAVGGGAFQANWRLPDPQGAAAALLEWCGRS